MGRESVPESQRSVVVNFSLTPASVKRLNDFAAKTGRKKSQIVETAVIEYLDRAETQEKPQS